MRFYGNGIAWDAENNKRLCKFSRPTEPHGKGVFETDDKRICAELVRLGYPCDPELPVVNNPTVWIDDGKPIPESVTTTNVPEGAPYVVAGAESVTADMSAKELREIGKELGLSFPASMKKTEMADAINAKQEA